MKRFISIILAAVLLMACIPAAHAANAYDKSRLKYDDAFTFLTLLNQKRTSMGLGSLTMDCELLDAASLRAYEQTISFGHTRPDGSKYSTVAPKKAHAECVHYYYPPESSTPKCALQEFMNSPPHKAILLDGQYKSVGVGVYDSGDRKNWAVVLSMYGATDSVSLNDVQPKKTVASFSDVFETDYYAKSVQWAVQKKITVGTSKTTFEPNAMCTRGQIVTFLWRAAGSPKASINAASQFADVKSGSYYSSAVNWALENNITAGTNADTFSPDLPCTRAEAVTFLWRAAGSPKSLNVVRFNDVSANSFYAQAVSWAVNKGITSGTGANKFSPDATCTRAQFVTFLYRQ